MADEGDLELISEEDIEEEILLLKEGLKREYQKNPLITVGEAVDNIQNDFYSNLEDFSEERRQMSLVRELALEDMSLDDIQIRRQLIADYLPEEYLKD